MTERPKKIPDQNRSIRARIGRFMSQLVSAALFNKQLEPPRDSYRGRRHRYISAVIGWGRLRYARGPGSYAWADRISTLKREGTRESLLLAAQMLREHYKQHERCNLPRMPRRAAQDWEYQAASMQ